MDGNELIEVVSKAVCLANSDTRHCWCKKNGLTCQSQFADIKPSHKETARAVLTAIEAAGMAVVPVNATDYQWNIGGMQLIKADNAAGIYRAMIEAGKI